MSKEELAKKYAKTVWKNGRSWEKPAKYSEIDYLAGDSAGYERGVRDAERICRNKTAMNSQGEVVTTWGIADEILKLLSPQGGAK